MDNKYNKTILLQEYNDFISRQGRDALDFDEFVMIKEETYREFDPKWKQWLMKGLAGAVGAVAGHTYGKHSKSSGAGSLVKNRYVGSALGLPIGLFLAKLYSTQTDTCRKSCGNDKLCYYDCYVKASDMVISKIKKDIAQVKNLHLNDDDEAKMHKKLLGKLRYYQQKREGFIKKVNQYDKGGSSPSPQVDIYDTRGKK